MKEVLKYYGRYIPLVLVLLVFLYIQATCELALPGYMADIVDSGILKGNQEYIYQVGIRMLGLSMVSLVCFLVVGLIAAVVSASVVKRLRDDFFQKTTYFSKAEIQKFSTASLITRATNDMQQIQTTSVMIMRMAFFAPIMGACALVRAIATSPSLSWTIGVAVIAVFVQMLVTLKVTMPKFTRVQKLVDRLNLVVNERLSGILVVRGFCAESREEKRFDQVNRELTDVNIFINRIMSLNMPLMMTIMNLTTMLVVWVGAGLVETGNLEIGSILAFIQYAMHVIMSFLFISLIFIMVPRSLVAAKRVGEVLVVENSIKEDENPIFPEISGQVEFKNVSFKYPDAEEYVLKDVSFTAKKGETTAIIGSTGSGKSTLINLIPRFYDVSEGSILIDGFDIRKMSQKHLRDNIGYVPQKGVLFSGTIESNLRFGKEEASYDEMEEAAGVAQALDFILDKKEGFAEPIAQGGNNVSGGQKQRLSIARALVKKPPVYIFDDSFSALDYKTDAALRRALAADVTDATKIIVAQRISTIRDADKILVMDEGRIVDMGKHQQLLKSCQVYREIAESQLDKGEML